ncbi:riboflavin biosynthesis protein RibD [Sulfuriferula sp. AH1]|uniref:bifunctional diaminohydroxyphosphoribosylaminopyrimidine deaminase/5-amino-6-(5-phosphoribosylamino)uracil reductase RibD n=1 Tax=Sulfuriferula sp. AH1 TaxID=1985873 RepID=UPI000B3B3D7E|nr:bifunctional diaminohydroxyphosphoribosylaminopyrimidine deaminase/5-amino-6-(5-phosphoribosylamino)uracil reductase RibD [Sulfuriferula sp. AH1]ARU32253.1 riboflavin biosynthesis protein RibD [Sulfuriferula sp. AH1]
MWTADDYTYMAQALRLAERGLYTTSPNPRVGCVIVKDTVVVGEGWHQRAGEPHAEVLALRQAGESARGATAYVTLEPCSHFGRTPPCADALVAAGIAKVIAAMQDPNPQVAGNGLARLAAAGIATSCGLLEQQAQQLNIGFIQRMTRARPWLRIKTASSLDGKIALANGTSKWITGAAARQDAHRLRARSCAILTGIGTVLADNPQLNVRDVDTTRQPLKIIVDSHLRTPADALILRDSPTIIVYTQADTTCQEQLTQAGAELIQVNAHQGQVDLSALMSILAQRGINEVMTEAGAHLNAALIAANLVDEWVMYIAPTLLGDTARGLFALAEPADMTNRRTLSIHDIRQIGTDLRITAHFK